MPPSVQSPGRTCLGGRPLPVSFGCAMSGCAMSFGCAIFFPETSGRLPEKCSTLLIVFRLPGFLLEPSFEHKQFRERRIRVRRPFAQPLLLGGKSLAAPFLALVRVTASRASRLPAAAMTSETWPLFARAPLATILMATLEGLGRGSGLILRKRRCSGSGAVRRLPGNRLARRRDLRGCFRSGGTSPGWRSVAPFKRFFLC